MVYRYSALLLIALLSAVMSGCADTPKDPDKEIPPEVDKVLGRDRPDYEHKNALESFFSSDDKQQKQAAAVAKAVDKRLDTFDQRLSRIEQQVAMLSQSKGSQGGSGAAAAQPAAPSGRTIELGLAVSDAGAGGQLDNSVQSAVADTARSSGLAFATAADVSERLNEAGCRHPSDPGCLAELATYPGVRMLVDVSQMQMQQDAAVVTYRLMDTVLGKAYPPRTVRMPVANGQVPQQSLSSMADSIVFTAMSLADKAPWQARAFNQRNGQWYISAGQRSGLKTGDLLRIHAPGHTIATPGGNVAGWVPGKPKGTLKIVGFAGKDIAIAELTDGQAPKPTDPLLPETGTRNAQNR